VLGIILGDLLDKSLRRGLTISNGSLEPFFVRPISAVFVAIILLSVVFSVPASRRALARLLDRLGPGRGRRGTSE
jgi:putative tricarboxylic transport membrane protein